MPKEPFLRRFPYDGVAHDLLYAARAALVAEAVREGDLTVLLDPANPLGAELNAVREALARVLGAHTQLHAQEQALTALEAAHTRTLSQTGPRTRRRTS